MTHYIRPFQQRDDHVPGYIYLLEAEGYHGWIPGCALKRCKIGLTRSVESRLDTLHSSQPPCNYKLVKAIYVKDMGSVEDSLHKQFKHRNVKLIKSREWFDILPWQYAHILWMFNRYDSKRSISIPPKLIAGSLVALLGVGLFIGYSIRENATPQLQQGIERK
ncbi:MAG: GIY-YIG nuclease family protein [Scytonema sp. RU_4_4]|nr:GIY-YIG nuclease family protein [Scytonema sp. RU_4_4]